MDGADCMDSVEAAACVVLLILFCSGLPYTGVRNAAYIGLDTVLISFAGGPCLLCALVSSLCATPTSRSIVSLRRPLLSLPATTGQQAREFCRDSITCLNSL